MKLGMVLSNTVLTWSDHSQINLETTIVAAVHLQAQSRYSKSVIHELNHLDILIIHIQEASEDEAALAAASALARASLSDNNEGVRRRRPDEDARDDKLRMYY